ncbi:MAG: hypothetical protein KGL39_12315 [Patescibacteria group bacterium]|nr:hypothetical protein [Patescibacteria group bacterium]
MYSAPQYGKHKPKHDVGFSTSARSGLSVGQCTCGWYVSGTLDSVMSKANTHERTGGTDDKAALKRQG